jgi:hypothetical protein
MLDYRDAVSLCRGGPFLLITQRSRAQIPPPLPRSEARVTIVDADGTSARVCPRHALAALNGITGAHVNWPDSKGLNEWERKALELAEERSQLG